MKKEQLLGGEWGLANLINGDEDTPTKQRIKQTGRKYALDLGCAEASDLLMLHHTFEFKRLEGVDCNPEALIMQKFNKDFDRSYASRYEAYRGGFTLGPNDAVRTHMTQEEFKAKLSIRERLVQEYSFKEAEYDVIIACHLLHYLSKRDVEGTVRRILAHLALGGVYYIRIRRTPSAEVNWKPEFTYHDCQILCRELLEGSGVAEYIHPPYRDERNKNRDEETVWTNL